MTTLTCTLATRAREKQMLKRPLPIDDVGRGLREAISSTQERIDSAFAHQPKFTAKLKVEDTPSRSL